MKDTYYFSHDYYSRKDPKCSALISDFGMEGYGLYWMLIELLHEQGGKIKKFPKLYEGLAFQFNMPKDNLSKQIEAMLHQYELLVEDENFIWSERVLRNIEEREEKRRIKAESGRLGGISSGITRNRSKPKQCFEANEANEAKESKVKESKVKESKVKEEIPHPFLKNSFFLKTFEDFKEMRKTKKSPLTHRAIELTLKQLEKYPIETAIEILEQSIKNSWKGLFEIKQQYQKVTSGYEEEGRL